MQRQYCQVKEWKSKKSHSFTFKQFPHNYKYLFTFNMKFKINCIASTF